MLFTTKSRSDKSAPELDSSQFGHFGNLTRPYKDAERKYLDRERYLQTLTEVAAEKNSTLIFPVPIDVFSAFADMARSIAEENQMRG